MFIVKIGIPAYLNRVPLQFKPEFFKGHCRECARLSVLFWTECCWNLEKIGSRYPDYIAQNLRLESNRNVGFNPRG